MKNFFKKCLIYSSIIYVIFSIILICTTIIISKDAISSLELLNVNQTSETTIVLPENTSVDDFVQLSKYTTKIDLMNLYIGIFILSVFLGIMISLFQLIKEFSIIKYFIGFIIGNVFFNLIYSLITFFVYNSYGIELSFVRIFIDTVLKLLIPYVAIFIIVILIIILFTKYNVKKLNKQLSGK